MKTRHVIRSVRGSESSALQQQVYVPIDLQVYPPIERHRSRELFLKLRFAWRVVLQVRVTVRARMSVRLKLEISLCEVTTR